MLWAKVEPVIAKRQHEVTNRKVDMLHDQICHSNTNHGEKMQFINKTIEKDILFFSPGYAEQKRQFYLLK
jgi:hypothetical protein